MDVRTALWQAEEPATPAAPASLVKTHGPRGTVEPLGRLAARQRREPAAQAARAGDVLEAEAELVVGEAELVVGEAEPVVGEVGAHA
ncbi:hypothetical protein [Streptomyces flaveolus]|uniref:hypothetical protein n=1 Tax=Streptomyces flaveolus TaxID=67297 RepID=UPI00370003FF